MTQGLFRSEAEAQGYADQYQHDGNEGISAADGQFCHQGASGMPKRAAWAMSVASTASGMSAGWPDILKATGSRFVEGQAYDMPGNRICPPRLYMASWTLYGLHGPRHVR
jgi:hypothetical protein